MMRNLYSVECDECCNTNQLAWLSEDDARRGARQDGWALASSDTERDLCPGCTAIERCPR